MTFLSDLFTSTFDHFSYTASQDASGGISRSYPPTATHAAVACSWQPEDSEMTPLEKVRGQQQYRQQRRGTIYFDDATVWAVVKPWDGFKIDGVRYIYHGGQNAGNIGMLYKLVVIEDLSDQQW